MTSTRRLGWISLALLALAGCGKADSIPEGPKSPTPASPTTEGVKTGTEIKSMPVDGPKTEVAAEPAKLSDAEIAEIKKLPADEQPIALAQVSCPVSDGHLGDMGVPIKKVVDGKTVYLCCGGCEKSLEAEPAKYLAKLKK